jgi:lactoylglutathione lyase
LFFQRHFRFLGECARVWDRYSSPPDERKLNNRVTNRTKEGPLRIKFWQEIRIQPQTTMYCADAHPVAISAPKFKEFAMAACTWDHIHLRSPDPESTAQWFERMLGAEVIRSLQQGQPRIDLKLGGAMIFIAEVKAGDGVNPAPTTPYHGLDHFGLAVRDIDTVAADLKKKGVEFTKEPHIPRPGIKICFLRGPQGISIELLERDPKYS